MRCNGKKRLRKIHCDHVCTHLLENSSLFMGLKTTSFKMKSNVKQPNTISFIFCVPITLLWSLIHSHASSFTQHFNSKLSSLTSITSTLLLRSVGISLKVKQRRGSTEFNLNGSGSLSLGWCSHVGYFCCFFHSVLFGLFNVHLFLCV